MLEQSFSMLKPGVLQRRLMGRIISTLEEKGLRIVALKMFLMDDALVNQHYEAHREKAFFPELSAFMKSSPVVAMVVEGENAVSLLRMLCGATKVEDALPGTIRGDFAMSTGQNIIHASDSSESAKREISLFFKPEEIFDWKDGNDEWL